MLLEINVSISCMSCTIFKQSYFCSVVSDFGANYSEILPRFRCSDQMTHSSSKTYNTNDVKTARKKIQEEWDALKNATIISNESPEGALSKVLYGVVAYIEIKNVDRPIALRVILESMGATVKDKFTPEVTHVIFKSGTFDTFQRAKLLNAHLVSVLWIEACRSARKRIPEELFPVAGHNYYTSPRTFIKLVEQGCQNDSKPTNNVTLRNTQERNKQTNTKRQNRPSDTPPGDSSDSALVLQISMDDSEIKKDKRKEIKEPPKQKRTQRLFSSAGDEEIDHDPNKKKQESRFKRKLFTNRLDESTIGEDSEASSIAPKSRNNPYGLPCKKNKTSEKKQAKEANTVSRKEVNLSESSQSSDSQHSLDNMEQIRELIKLTQSQGKPANKKRQKAEKKKKLTKAEKDNIKKANKMARRQENQTIKASQPRSGKKIIKEGSKTPTLVTTYMHAEENKLVAECVSRLGGFRFVPSVRADTTHVVCGGAVRTLNLLKGLARGCWLVKAQWLHDSLAAGHWLTEHDYELVDFSPAVQKCRLERSVLGDDYRQDVFSSCGAIYIEMSSPSFRTKAARALLSLCRANLVGSTREAALVVGGSVAGRTCVSEAWVLDSVAAGRPRSLRNYSLASPVRNPSQQSSGFAT